MKCSITKSTIGLNLLSKSLSKSFSEYEGLFFISSAFKFGFGFECNISKIKYNEVSISNFEKISFSFSGLFFTSNNS